MIETADTLETNTYSISTGKLRSERLLIALIADLHDRPCDELVDALKRAKPDIITIAGDLMELCAPDRACENAIIVNEPTERRVSDSLSRFMHMADACALKRPRVTECFNNEHAYAFLRSAASLAPTFYALGNHERYISSMELIKIASTGVRLLNNADSACSIRGLRVRVGALSTAYDLNWLSQFSGSEADLRVLLCHHPEYYERFSLKSHADVVLSGHAHGGQWRLFGKPVFAPGQGLFPKYACGVYDNALVVSRGLANTACAPRLWNKRELAIVELD